MSEPFDYDRLAAFEKVLILYNGHGDEGFINEIRPEPEIEGVTIADDLYEELESWASDVLEENFGGWEINEGSDGDITIDVKARTTLIHHGWVVESHNYEDVEF